MNSALLFLVARSLRGRVLRLLRLARRPKYFIGFLLTLGWMGVWFWPWMSGRRSDGELVSILDSAADVVPAIQTAVALVLALLFTLWWLWPFGKPNIGLKESELQLLLPAPLPRREIIRFAMLKAQPPILFGCGLMTLFFRAPSWDRAVQHFVGLWLALTIWDLHSKGKRLWLGRQRELPSRAAAARWGLLLAGLGAFWLAVAAGLSRIDWTVLASVEGTEGFLEAATGQAERLLNSPGGWALTPFGWMAAPFLHNLPGVPIAPRLLSLLGPLLLLVAHERWVGRSQAGFEEATLDAARRKAQEVGGLAKHARKSKRERARVPFPLSSLGTPEVAVFWKNLILTRRTPLTRQLALGLAVAAGVGVFAGALPVPEWALFIPLVSGFFLMTIIPMVGVSGFRNDFRADLKQVEAIRPWPMRGWKLMAAEVLSPVAVAAVTAWTGAAMVLAFDLATLGRSEGPALQFWATLAESLGVTRPFASIFLVLSVVPLSLTMGLFSSALQNLTTLAFPGWVPLGFERKEVAQHMGTNLLLTLIRMLGMFLALIPGLLIAAAAALGQTVLLGIPVPAWELPLLAVLAATPPLALTATAIILGGELWQRMDPSEELLDD